MPQFHQSQDARNEAEAGSAVPTAMLHQAETWSRTQCELLSGIESIWSRLLQWQREAIDASTRSLVEISESRDLGNILQVQQHWFEGAVRRTTSNWSEFANDAAALTWRVARVDRPADPPQTPAPTSRQRQGAKDETQLLHREAAK